MISEGMKKELEAFMAIGFTITEWQQESPGGPLFEIEARRKGHTFLGAGISPEKAWDECKLYISKFVARGGFENKEGP